MTSKHYPRVAIVYDRVNSTGGAERVLQKLHEAFPQAPLYTSVYDASGAKWAENWIIKTSWLQCLPWLRARHRLVGWLMPVVFETMDVADESDVIISVTSEAAKAVITKPEQLHVCYLLAPTRYLWSHAEHYEQQLPPLLRHLWRKIRPWWQNWDQVAALRPDVIIPISQQIKQQSERYYHLEVEEPLYPPPAVLPTPQVPQFKPETPFFFCWGRHVKFKRFDVAIKAAVEQQRRLLIAGRGPASKKWEQLAQKIDPQKQYIQFIGQISDAQLAWYLQQAVAVIFPQPDDFGLAPLEAQLQGCPVIIHQQSGVAEVLSDRKSGVFINETSVKAVRKAMELVEQKNWSRLDIARQASQYAGVEYVAVWRDLISNYWHKHQTMIANTNRDEGKT